MKTLPPGSTIGILGGGQLGRMLSIAAAQLGYRCHIFAPDKNSVAADVSAEFTCASENDEEALRTFAESCDVLTFEFENVPTEPLEKIAGLAPLHPPIAALDVAQHRTREKEYARDLGGTTAPFAEVNTRDDLDTALETTGLPAILKTIRMGYDGKGQARISDGDDLDNHWEVVGHQPCIAEGFVDFSHEFSVILVRGHDGEIRYWDSPHNVHIDGILASSTVPAPDSILAQQDKARELASRLARKLDYVGVLTCEFFVGKDGPIFNEMAPRVHNSGHWTIEGAITSQFENHIRAICGLPLGETGLAAQKVTMTNLIGKDAAAWGNLLSDGANHLHLYGKSEIREGRKMGHVTKLYL